MAEKEQDQGAEAEAGGGGKKKLILLIVLALVLIGVSVGGTLVALNMLGGDEPAATAVAEGGEAVAAEAAAAVPATKTPAIYYPLMPSIIVNFNSQGKQRYLQADVSLMVREDDVVAALEQHSAMLQATLLMLFGAQDYNELQTAEGRELLRQQSLEALRQKLEAEIGKPGIEQVLFTNFVMQ